MSVAILLAKKGANVTIVARNVDKLTEALKEINVRFWNVFESTLKLIAYPITQVETSTIL